MLESSCIVGKITQAILPHNRRSVIFGIETYADQVRLRIVLWRFRQLPVDSGKIAANEGTNLERASRVDECNQNGFTFEFGQMQCFSILVRERNIRYRLT